MGGASVMSEVAKIWFEQAKKLQVDEALFVRVANKKEQTALANEFEKERELYGELDPVHASQIFINKTLMDRKQYVVLERKFRTPFTAFFRDSQGKFSSVTIDPEGKRIIKVMIGDGKTREEIESTLNGLTDDERAEFFYEVD